jgi:hypothetical protein
MSGYPNRKRDPNMNRKNHGPLESPFPRIPPEAMADIHPEVVNAGLITAGLLEHTVGMDSTLQALHAISRIVHDKECGNMCFRLSMNHETGELVFILAAFRDRSTTADTKDICAALCRSDEASDDTNTQKGMN